jgi:hypothetical protein
MAGLGCPLWAVGGLAEPSWQWRDPAKASGSDLLERAELVTFQGRPSQEARRGFSLPSGEAQSNTTLPVR